MNYSFSCLLFVLLASCSGTQTPVERDGLPDASFSWSVSETPYQEFDVPVITPLPLPATDSSVILPIRVGEPSRINGVVLNNVAVAQVEVRVRTIQEQCRIERTADLRVLGARALADIHHLQESFTSVAAQNRLIIQSRDDEIERLNRRISTNNNLIWLGLGTGIGLLLLGGGVLLAQ